MSDLPEIPRRPLKSKSGSPDTSIDKETQGAAQPNDDLDDGFTDSDGIDNDSDDGDEHRVTLDPESQVELSNSLEFLKSASSSKTQEEPIIPNIPPRPTREHSVDIPIIPKRPSAKASLKSGNSSELELPTALKTNSSTTEVSEPASVDNNVVEDTDIPSIPKRPSSLNSGNSSKLELLTPLEPKGSELSVDNTVVDNITNVDIPSIPKRPSKKAKETLPAESTQLVDSETLTNIPTIPQRPKRVSDLKLESNNIEDDGTYKVETPQVLESKEVSVETPSIPERPKGQSNTTSGGEADDLNTNEVDELEDSIPSVPERPLSKLNEEVDSTAEDLDIPNSSNNEAPLQSEADDDDDDDDKEPEQNTSSLELKPIELETDTESLVTVPEFKNTSQEDEPVLSQTKEQTTNESVPIIPKRPTKKPAVIDTDTTTAITEQPLSRSTTTPSLGQTSEFPAVKKSLTDISNDPSSSVTDEILDIYGGESPVQTKIPEQLPLQTSGSSSKKAPPPPPKPKKPSSRILAFQQQLMASQKEALENRPIVPSHRPKPPSRTSTSSSIVSGGGNDDSSKEDLPDVPKSRPNKKQTDFAKNLNGLLGGIALPGMVLPGLFNPSISTRDANADEEQVKDVRRSRAKGPRGRKLPTAATAPVISDESKFKIYVADAWEVKTALETIPLEQKPIEELVIDENEEPFKGEPVQEESETKVETTEAETVDGTMAETIDVTKREAIDEILEGQDNGSKAQTTDEIEQDTINESRQDETKQEINIDGTKEKTAIETLEAKFEDNSSSDKAIIAPTDIDMSENSLVAGKLSLNDFETIELHEDNDNEIGDAGGNALQDDVFSESKVIETPPSETADE